MDHLQPLNILFFSIWLYLINQNEFPERDKYICKSYREKKHFLTIKKGGLVEEVTTRRQPTNVYRQKLSSTCVKTMKRKLFERHVYLLHHMNCFVSECPEVGICVIRQRRNFAVAKAQAQTVTKCCLINIYRQTKSKNSWSYSCLKLLSSGFSLVYNNFIRRHDL